MKVIKEGRWEGKEENGRGKEREGRRGRREGKWENKRKGRGRRKGGIG